MREIVTFKKLLFIPLFITTLDTVHAMELLQEQKNETSPLLTLPKARYFI